VTYWDTIPLICNQGVAGSNPAAGTSKIGHFRQPSGLRFFLGGNLGAIPNSPNAASTQFVRPAAMDLGRVILTGKPADVCGDASLPNLWNRGMSFIDIRGLTAGVANWLGWGAFDLSADAKVSRWAIVGKNAARKSTLLNSFNYSGSLHQVRGALEMRPAYAAPSMGVTAAQVERKRPATEDHLRVGPFPSLWYFVPGSESR
jgi:hypothetical protein